MINAPSNDAWTTIASGDPVDVRSFSVRQRMNELFLIELVVVSTNLDIDFDEVIGQDADFALQTAAGVQRWSGVCIEMAQERVEEAGLATYRIQLAPRAWLMTQRKNYRIFQFESELDIVKKLLSEWGVAYETRVGSHKPRKFRTQYGETDFAFCSRLLEDAGINYTFESSDDGTKIVLDDAPESRELTHPLLRFHDEPRVTDGSFITKVGIRSRTRPGKMTIGDIDYRRPSAGQPRLEASFGLAQESALEQFDHEPGAFLYQTGAGGTPFADDRGASRTDESVGAQKTMNRLLGKRGDAKVVRFESDVLALEPGRILTVVDHPHRALEPTISLLVVGACIAGEHASAWRVQVEAVRTDVPYRPAPITPKPVVPGLESATVVGPGGEEIHTDEFARVRVHFHWDRESSRNESSSCWVPTNQPWAGRGFGAINMPRIGQEVLVEFLGGDPDRPVVIGRVFTRSNPVPDKLPKYKHVSGFMSESTPRLVMGAAGDGGVGANSGLFGGTPMSPEQIHSTVTQAGPFQAASPTGQTHAWRGSGLKLDDFSGSEICYIQANRDLHVVVANDWKSVVGNHRTATIGTDDITHVKANQTVVVDVDQKTTVTGDAMTKVERDRSDQVLKKHTMEVNKTITTESKVGNLTIYAKGDITFECDETIELKARHSFIKLMPTEIVVQSADNKVDINPV
jgi:type VI secretion system secreted protein VgrG